MEVGSKKKKGESMNQILFKFTDQELKLLVRLHRKFEKELGCSISRKQLFILMIKEGLKK